MRIDDAGPAPVPYYDERKEIADMKRELNRIRAQRAADDARNAAQTNTATKRKIANDKVNEYNAKVDAHQKQWLQENGYKYSTQAALQAAWQKAWETDGKAARDELEPYLVDYDQAVREDLRLAADQGGPAAVEKRAKEIKGLDRSNSHVDQFLDGLVSGASVEIAHETPAMRAAARQLDAAAAEWGEAQKIPEADRRMNSFLQQRYETAERNYNEARANYIKVYGDQFSAEITAGLQAGKTLDQIKAEIKANHGGASNPFIEYLVDYRALVYTNGEKIDEWMVKINTNPDGIGLTAAERKLAETDPYTLAFLKAAGFTLELDPAKFEAAHGYDLSPEELKLAEDNPVLFCFLQKQNIHFWLAGPTLQVQVDGKAAPGQLQTIAQNAYNEGGITGFASTLSSPMWQDPNMLAFMEGADAVRTKYGSQDIYKYDGMDRVHFTNKLLSGYFSQEARTKFWQQTGRPAVEPIIRDALKNVPFQKHDDLNDARYLTYIGEYMDEALKDGTPEMAGLVLDLVMPQVDSVSLDTMFGNTEVFTRSLGNAVALADLAEGSRKADQVAYWLVHSDRGLIDRESIGEFRNAIATTGQTKLAYAVYGELKADDIYTDGFPDEFKWGITDGEGAAQEILGAQQARADYTALMDPAQHKTLIDNYFDRFIQKNADGTPKIKNVGQTVSTANTPQLRNLLGQMNGYQPTQNLNAYNAGDDSVDWYAEGTPERAIINLTMSWIDMNDGDGKDATVLIMPYIYASERDGVTYGSLLKIKASDGTEALVDAGAADDAISFFLNGMPSTITVDGDNIKVGDKTYHQDDMPLQWDYKNYDDFIDHNQYDTHGKLYLPKDWNLTASADGHVQWTESQAARQTGGETFMKVVDGVAIVAVTIAGLALAPVTAGGSLALTATVVGVLVVGTGWTIYSADHRRAEMGEHGESTKWSNPAARDTYIQEIMAVFSLLPLGSGARAVSLTRSGVYATEVGQITRNAQLVTQGERLLSTAGTYGQIAKWTGIPNTIAGVYFVGNQAYVLATNADKMTEGEILESASYLLFGISQFGVGAASRRIPGLQRMLKTDPRFTNEETARLVSLSEIAKASDAGVPVDPLFGKYYVLPDGEAMAVPSIGRAAIVYPAPKKVDLVMPGANRNAHSGPIVVPGHEPPANNGPLIVPGAKPAYAGEFYGPSGARINITDTVASLQARGIIGADILPSEIAGKDTKQPGAEGDGQPPLVVANDRRGGDRSFINRDGPPALTRLGTDRTEGAPVNVDQAENAPFIIRMTTGRQTSLEMGRNARADHLAYNAESAVRSQFGDWIDPNGPRMKPAVRLDGPEFQSIYTETGGTKNPDDIQGIFVYGDRQQSYLQNRPANYMEPFTKGTAGHEYIHGYASPAFGAFLHNVVSLRTQTSIVEGVTEYLSFKALGPKEFTERPGGYAAYIADLKLRNAATPENLSYHHEAQIAEMIFETMGSGAYAAYFHGDSGALVQFFDLAIASGEFTVKAGPAPALSEAAVRPSGNQPVKLTRANTKGVPQVILKDPPVNPYREPGDVVGGSWLHRRFASVADRRALYLDGLADYLHVDRAVVRSEIVQDIVDGIPVLGRLVDVTADAHAHPRPYDRRWGDRPRLLVAKVGWGGRVLVGEIPQECGVGHYSNIASRKLTLKRAGLLDRKAVKSWDRMFHTYDRWTRALETVARDIDPELAIAINQVVLKGGTVRYKGWDRTLSGLTQQVEMQAPQLHRTLSKQISTLAEKEPHAILRYDLSMTGFNPGSAKAAKQIRARLINAPGRRAFLGELTLHKEMVDAMLGKEGTTFRDRQAIDNFRNVMKLANESGLGVLIHCDWGTIGYRPTDGRPQAGTHEYQNFDQLIMLVEQYPNANIVLAHTGIGRYVRPSSKAVLPTDVIAGTEAQHLAPAAFQRVGNISYGSSVPMHVFKMEEALTRAPHVKFDISWNDVGEAFVTNPALFEGLIRFIQRHPDAVLFGSDTVKPVNKGQYRQAFNTLLPLFGELATRPNGGELLWKLLRGNYVETMNRAFYGDSSGANGVIAWTANRGTVGSGAKMQTMHDLLNNGLVVNGRQIVEGRDAITTSARAEFDTVIADFLAGGVRMRGPKDSTSTAPVVPGDLSTLYSAAFGGRPINLVPSDPSGESPHQTGTGQGSPMIQFPGSRARRVASGVMRSTLIAGAGLAGATFGHGFVGPAAAMARQLLFIASIKYRDFVRVTWDQMFEEGQITNRRLDAFVTRVLKHGNRVGIDREALTNVVRETLNFREDVAHILNSSEGQGLSQAQQFDAVLAAVGLYQIRVDRVLGVQAASLEGTLPQTRLGRWMNSRIEDTANMSMVALLVETGMQISKSGLEPATSTKAALDLIALAAMVGARAQMNKGGLVNSELVDNKALLRWLNTVSFSGIAAGGGAGIWVAVADWASNNPTHSWPADLVLGTINGFIAYHGIKVAGYEASRQLHLGGPDTGKLFDSSGKLVTALAAAAAAQIIIAAIGS